MKCPKCGYLGFERVDRCRNCGYDFSLSRTDRHAVGRRFRFDLALVTTQEGVPPR